MVKGIGVHHFSFAVGSDGCTDNSVQLLGGSEPGEGRPEFCTDNTWTPMCSLSAATASLICQELGFTEYTGRLTSSNTCKCIKANVN